MNPWLTAGLSLLSAITGGGISIASQYRMARLADRRGRQTAWREVQRNTLMEIQDAITELHSATKGIVNAKSGSERKEYWEAGRGPYDRLEVLTSRLESVALAQRIETWQQALHEILIREVKGGHVPDEELEETREAMLAIQNKVAVLLRETILELE